MGVWLMNDDSNNFLLTSSCSCCCYCFFFGNWVLSFWYFIFMLVFDCWEEWMIWNKNKKTEKTMSLRSISPIQKAKLDHFTAGSEPTLVQDSWSNRFSANFHSLPLSLRKSINLSRGAFPNRSSFWPEKPYASFRKEEDEQDEEVDDDDVDDEEERDKIAERESFCSVCLSKWISIDRTLHYSPQVQYFHSKLKNVSIYPPSLQDIVEVQVYSWKNLAVPLQIRREVNGASLWMVAQVSLE